MTDTKKQMAEPVNLYLLKKIRIFPLNFLLGYQILTIILFIFSPWNYSIENPSKFFTFLTLSLGMFYIGGRFAIFIRRNSKYISDIDISWNHRLMSIFLLIQFLMTYPNILIATGRNFITVDEIFALLLQGISNSALNYSLRRDFSLDFSSLINVISSYLTFSLVFIQYYVLSWGIWFWKRLSNFEKIIYVFIILINIVISIMIGTNKAIFDYFLWVPWLILAANSDRIIKKGINLRRVFVSFILGIILFLLSLSFFTDGQQGRRGNNWNSDLGAEAFLDNQHFIMKVLPDKSAIKYAFLNQYLCQGYWALDKCLAMDFVYSGGFGHSPFIVFFFASRLGYDPNSVFELTYPVRLERIYPNYLAFVRWHTMYTWWAGDITWWGIPILLFLIGFLFMNVWIDVLYYKIATALPLVPLLFIMIFYFSANNQIFAFQGSCISFWVCLFIWLFTRKRVIKNHIR